MYVLGNTMPNAIIIVVGITSALVLFLVFALAAHWMKQLDQVRKAEQMAMPAPAKNGLHLKTKYA